MPQNLFDKLWQSPVVHEEADGTALAFDVDPFRKEYQANRWNDIGLTLRHAEKTHAFENQRRVEQPRLFA